MSGEGGAIAEVLAAHAPKYGIRDMRRHCICGWAGADHDAHRAEVLADLLAAERQRGRAEALREAAKEAEERGDIGKDGGCEAWTWLRIRADRIAETP